MKSNRLKFSIYAFILLGSLGFYCLSSDEQTTKTDIDKDIDKFETRICKCPLGSEAVWGRTAKTPEGEEYCGSCNYK